MWIMKRSAIISTCGLYRYELRRVWDDRLPPMAMIMLNPSTADAQKDDPTIRRCIGFAETNRCGSLIVGNLGAGRSSSPAIWMWMDDPIGPDNDAHLARILTECSARNGLAVVAWGAHGAFRRRNHAFMKIAAGVRAPLWCLGVTKTGEPRHPLYIKKDAAFVSFLSQP